MTSLFSFLFRRAERNRVLSRLSQLDDHLLDDIGLARTDITQMRRSRRTGRGPIARAHE